eukprot:GEMP01046132.1.p1 GENE.GEMP01046132.1~~GEMP01046132.1.p1  ORF type:complete len:213 (+),score=46.73 GEMP01046132.1:473-1111(+)
MGRLPLSRGSLRRCTVRVCEASILCITSAFGVAMDGTFTKGYTEAVPIDAMMEIARPVLNKIGDVPSLQADVVLQNCLQSDLCDANYHVDFDKVAQFYARALLHETKKMPLELFKRRWQSKLPEMRELDCLKPPLYVFDTDVHYIDELELSHDPAIRLKQLFKLQKKWNPDLLVEAMSSSLPNGNTNAWLIKNARFLSVNDEKSFEPKFALS